MRIAQLSTMRGFYGGEVCLAALAAGLAARGHAVQVVARPGSALAARLADGRVPVATLPLVDWYEPRGLLRLRRWLRRERIQVLHTHVPRDHYLAAVATLGTRIVNVGTRHQLRPIRHAPLKRPFLDRLDAMTGVSEAVAHALRRGGAVDPARVLTVPNGLDPVPAAAPGGLRRRAGVPAGAPVVGAVGRPSPDKGWDVLLRAAAPLRRAHPGLRVFLVGGGPEEADRRRALARLAADLGLADAVTFFGYLPDAAAHVGDLDALAVCSRAEPFGLATLEAMGRGVPVVATDAGGTPELLRDGREGLLVPPGDPASLAAALGRLLDDPGLRRRLGAQGRRRARDYSGDAMAAAHEALYRRLLPARAGTRLSGGRSGPSAAGAATPAPPS